METDREKLIAYLKFLNLKLDPSNSRTGSESRK